MKNLVVPALIIGAWLAFTYAAPRLFAEDVVVALMFVGIAIMFTVLALVRPAPDPDNAYGRMRLYRIRTDKP